MAERVKIKCKEQFDRFLETTTQWVEEQKAMLEVKPTPEKIIAITKLYDEVIKKGKDFGKCEVASS